MRKLAVIILGLFSSYYFNVAVQAKDVMVSSPDESQ